MYKQLTNGRIKLRQLAEDAQYVWVTLNGELLACLLYTSPSPRD